MIELDPRDVADDLLKIHRHMPGPDDFEGTESASQMMDALPAAGIIYYEKDLLPLLKKWGIPPPDWDGNAKRHSKV